MQRRFTRHVSHARRNAVAIRVRAKGATIRAAPSAGVTPARRRKGVILARPKRDVIPALRKKAAIHVAQSAHAARAILVIRAAAQRRIIQNNALFRVYNWRQNAIRARRRRGVTLARRSAIRAQLGRVVVPTTHVLRRRDAIPAQPRRAAIRAQPRRAAIHAVPATLAILAAERRLLN